MATIDSSDILYITLITRGTASGTLRLTGIDSMSEVISNVRSFAPELSGMTTIDVRNSTRGWSSRNTLFLR